MHNAGELAGDNASVNLRCTHPPKSPWGYCGAFTPLSVWHVGHKQILHGLGVRHLPTFFRTDSFTAALLIINMEFKQIATATSTMAVVDAVSWGEYVS